MVSRKAFLLAYYKSFFARIWFNEEQQKWVGRILDVDDLIVFDGKTLEEALATFHSGIEEYMKASGGIVECRANTQVINMIRWGLETPDFEQAAENFLNEE